MPRLIDLDTFLPALDAAMAAHRERSLTATSRESASIGGILTGLHEARVLAERLAPTTATSGRAAHESALSLTTEPTGPETAVQAPQRAGRQRPPARRCPTDYFATASLDYRVPTGRDGRTIPTSTVYRATSRDGEDWLYLVKGTDGTWQYESSFLPAPIHPSRDEVYGMLATMRDLVREGRFRLSIYLRACW
jgi:hypothetical protein